MPVRIAESHLLPMAAQQENTAPMRAISQHDSGRMMWMNKNKLNTAEEFMCEKRYLAAHSVVESMLKAGLISPKELSEIDTKLLEKYRPSLSTLLCGRSLNYSR